MIYNNGLEGGELEGYEVADSLAALHPDYENWYQLGKKELNHHMKY